MFAILLTPALAAAPTPGTAATLSYGQGVGQVVVVTAPGEHVSAEAPATLSSPRGTVTGNGALDWARVAVEPGDLVSLTVGVCRDGGTECRVDSLVGTVPAKARGRVALSVPPPPATVSRPAGAAVRLYDFTAVWCPPCQRLGAEVLHDPDDAALLGPFEVVAVDADDPASWALKSRYRVTGYPTVLAVDADGNEVDRFLGYESDGRFERWVAGLDGATPLSKLEAGPAADATPGEAAAVALRLALADKEDAAKAWLGVASGDSQALHHARLLLVDEAQDDARWMLEHAPPGDWLYTLVDRYPELWPAAAPRVATLDPGTAAGCLDVYAGHQDADSADTALAARVGALALARSLLTGDPSHDRGRVVEIADLVVAVGDLGGGLALLTDFRTLYPAEFTWDFAMARHLLAAGRFQAEIGDAALFARARQ